MDIDALIPLRGGSKGIRDKNIKPLNGKPLSYYVLEACLGSKHLNQIYVSTDSEKIKKSVENLDSRIKIINRPIELGSDDASTESVMLHALDFIESQNIILLQATSPLTRSQHIDNAIESFSINKFDSLLSVVKSEKFIWNNSIEPVNYDYMNRKRRQNLDGYFVETGSFYISKKELIKKNKCRISGNIGAYTLPTEHIHEIDTLDDWCIIEKILNK